MAEKKPVIERLSPSATPVARQITKTFSRFAKIGLWRSFVIWEGCFGAPHCCAIFETGTPEDRQLSVVIETRAELLNRPSQVTQCHQYSLLLQIRPQACCTRDSYESRRCLTSVQYHWNRDGRPGW